MLIKCITTENSHFPDCKCINKQADALISFDPFTFSRIKKKNYLHSGTCSPFFSFKCVALKNEINNQKSFYLVFIIGRSKTSKAGKTKQKYASDRISGYGSIFFFASVRLLVYA